MFGIDIRVKKSSGYSKGANLRHDRALITKNILYVSKEKKILDQIGNKVYLAS